MSLADKVREFPGTVVLKEVDFGTYSYFWLAPMSRHELEQWWAAQETLEDDPPVTQEWIECIKALGWDENIPAQTLTQGRCVEWPGEQIRCETEEARNLWTELYMTGRYHFCHLWSDEDSFMLTPERRRIHHKGYDGPPIS